MKRLALLLLPLIVSTSAYSKVKVLKLGNLTVECFFAECEEKLKEVDGFIIENGFHGLGNIVTIAFSNWWSKPTVEGRTIINMYDSPEIIVSFLERHGAAARTALFDASDIADELRKKYDVEIKCERRTLAYRCAEVAKQVKEGLDAAFMQGRKPIPHKIEIVAIDWNVDKSTPKATIFGKFKDGSRRYQIKDVLTQQDVEQGFVANNIYFGF